MSLRIVLRRAPKLLSPLWVGFMTCDAQEGKPIYSMTLKGDATFQKCHRVGVMTCDAPEGKPTYDTPLRKKLLSKCRFKTKSKTEIIIEELAE